MKWTLLLITMYVFGVITSLLGIIMALVKGDIGEALISALLLSFLIALPIVFYVEDEE